jgi:hypothetical protein
MYKPEEMMSEEDRKALEWLKNYLKHAGDKDNLA